MSARQTPQRDATDVTPCDVSLRGAAVMMRRRRPHGGADSRQPFLQHVRGERLLGELDVCALVDLDDDGREEALGFLLRSESALGFLWAADPVAGLGV